MSIYSDISNKIGWERDTFVSPPSIDEAKDLYNDVLVNESEEAFEAVFRYHRFCPNPDGGEDEVAMNIVNEAYIKGQSFFR